MRPLALLRLHSPRAALPALCLAVFALSPGLACSRDDPGAGGSDGGNPGPTDATTDHTRIPYDGLAPPSGGPRTPVHAEFVSTRVDTMQLMFAAGEMQTSGEPFVQNFAGRQLGYYDRYYLPVDQYLVPVQNGSTFFEAVTDLFGFSSAVESYEYSKYHMNMIANQSRAGVSLANGPLIAKLPGAKPQDRLRGRIEQLIYAAGADVGGFAHLPPGGNPQNDFGFPGLWPNLDPYRSFDPAMTPDTTVAHSCTTVTGYGGVQQFGNNPVPTYECAYDTLQLTDRLAQTEHVIGPGVLGYTTWKEAIWAIDFTGRLHDAQANPVTAVAPGDLANVGGQGNQVQAVAPPGAKPGVFIGSTPLEGMWGLTMVDEMDNAGAWLLSSLATGDGATLGGFVSVAQAIQYDYGSPLLWFPAGVSVTEDGVGSYPGVASLAIKDASSRAVDLAALAQGYSLFFGMTDARNAAVGQQIGMQIAFDGTTFPADDGRPDGEDTPHDRALGVMRVAFVDLDRIHVDPATGVAVDSATVGGSGTVARGNTVSATSLGHVVVGLRHLLMACNAAVSQYGAPDGDASKDALGILNTVAIHPPSGPDGGAPPAFSARVRQVLLQQAAFVRDVLTAADGTVANGATLAGGHWSAGADPTAIESQGAALRVLVEAWFLTHDTTYQDRARAVARRLLTAFWSDPARMFRGQAGGADDVLMTPERFAWLQQALRETYEAIWLPGDALLDRSVLEDRIARVNKLFLNGWDDLNADQLVDKPGECLAARMQMGEQALTGELGTSSNAYQGSSGPDRDVDCVQNIAYTKTASVLAGQVHFHAP